jgi:hypothetical protein
MALKTIRLQDIPILQIQPYTLEHVHTFTHLATLLTKDNNIREEVRDKIEIANRCFFILQKYFKSNFTSRITKILLCKTLVRPIL